LLGVLLMYFLKKFRFSLRLACMFKFRFRVPLGFSFTD